MLSQTRSPCRRTWFGSQVTTKCLLMLQTSISYRRMRLSTWTICLTRHRLLHKLNRRTKSLLKINNLLMQLVCARLIFYRANKDQLVHSATPWQDLLGISPVTYRYVKSVSVSINSQMICRRPNLYSNPCPRSSGRSSIMTWVYKKILTCRRPQLYRVMTSKSC